MSSITRRQFVKRALQCACGAAAWGTLPGLGLKPAWADTGNGTKVLFINLNGGWDSLYVLQPLAGATMSTLAGMRSSLFTDPASLLPVNDQFGLHPSLSTFKSIYDSGQLCTVLNVGYQNMTRSHQDAEIAFARGVTDRLSLESSGFLNRMGSAFRWSSTQAVSVSGADFSFGGGSYRGIQVNGLSQFRFDRDNSQNGSENRHRQDSLVGASSQWIADPSKPKQLEVLDALEVAANTSEEIQSALRSAAFSVPYPNTPMGRSLKDIDVLFSTPNLGTEIGYVRRGGFDTHSGQIETLSTLLPELDGALSAFVANMKVKNLWPNLVIVLFSEFGRTNSENGSAGTDHGGASPVMLLGGGVRGGIVGELTVSDLTQNGWLPMRYNVVELYRQLVARMGYDPNLVLEPASGPSLSGLFI